jgi:hypothetical protein
MPMKFEADEDAAGAQGKQAVVGAGQQRLSFGPSGGTKRGFMVESSGIGRHSYFRFRKIARLADGPF